MYVITWLSAFRPGVPNTRSRFSVKATGAAVNLNNVEAGDVTGEVAKTRDIILYLLALYLT